MVILRIENFAIHEIWSLVMSKINPMRKLLNNKREERDSQNPSDV